MTKSSQTNRNPSLNQGLNYQPPPPHPPPNIINNTNQPNGLLTNNSIQQNNIHSNNEHLHGTSYYPTTSLSAYDITIRYNNYYNYNLNYNANTSIPMISNQLPQQNVFPFQSHPTLNPYLPNRPLPVPPIPFNGYHHTYQSINGHFSRPNTATSQTISTSQPNLRPFQNHSNNTSYPLPSSLSSQTYTPLNISNAPSLTSKGINNSIIETNFNNNLQNNWNQHYRLLSHPPPPPIPPFPLPPGFPKGFPIPPIPPPFFPPPPPPIRSMVNLNENTLKSEGNISSELNSEPIENGDLVTKRLREDKIDENTIIDDGLDEQELEPGIKLAKLRKLPKPLIEANLKFKESKALKFNSNSVEKVLPVYKKLSQIGEGTYGKVYKVFNNENNEYRALKALRLKHEKEGFPITAMREIKLLQNLRNERIVQLLEIFADEFSIYMVFEYMDYDLVGFLAHPKLKLNEISIKSITFQLLEGLDFLHKKKIVHRDLKGSNILLDKKGRVKIADFGLARLLDQKRNQDYTNRVITLWYRPPELLLGATNYNTEIDMWGAGCIMVELFQRKPLFTGKDELDQLDKIYALMGTPTIETFPNIIHLPWYELILPKQQYPNVFDEFCKGLMNEEARSLAEMLLQLDPTQRIGATKALEHSYFDDVRSIAKVEFPELDGDWHEYEYKQWKRHARHGPTSRSKPKPSEEDKLIKETLPHEAKSQVIQMTDSVDLPLSSKEVSTKKLIIQSKDHIITDLNPTQASAKGCKSLSSPSPPDSHPQPPTRDPPTPPPPPPNDSPSFGPNHGGLSTIDKPHAIQSPEQLDQQQSKVQREEEGEELNLIQSYAPESPVQLEDLSAKVTLAYAKYDVKLQQPSTVTESSNTDTAEPKVRRFYPAAYTRSRLGRSCHVSSNSNSDSDSNSDTGSKSHSNSSSGVSRSSKYRRNISTPSYRRLSPSPHRSPTRLGRHDSLLKHEPKLSHVPHNSNSGHDFGLEAELPLSLGRRGLTRDTYFSKTYDGEEEGNDTLSSYDRMLSRNAYRSSVHEVESSKRGKGRYLKGSIPGIGRSSERLRKLTRYDREEISSYDRYRGSGSGSGSAYHGYDSYKPGYSKEKPPELRAKDSKYDITMGGNYNERSRYHHSSHYESSYSSRSNHPHHRHSHPHLNPHSHSTMDTGYSTREHDKSRDLYSKDYKDNTNYPLRFKSSDAEASYLSRKARIEALPYSSQRRSSARDKERSPDRYRYPPKRYPSLSPTSHNPHSSSYHGPRARIGSPSRMKHLGSPHTNNHDSLDLNKSSSIDYERIRQRWLAHSRQLPEDREKDRMRERDRERDRGRERDRDNYYEREIR